MPAPPGADLAAGRGMNAPHIPPPGEPTLGMV